MTIREGPTSIRDFASSSFLTSRATIVTWAPCDAKYSDSASPKPDDPPVT